MTSSRLTLPGILALALTAPPQIAQAQGRTVPEAPAPTPRRADPLPTGPKPDLPSAHVPARNLPSYVTASTGPRSKALPDNVGDAIGSWEIALAGSGKRCVLELTGESGQNGRVLRFPAECRRSLPLLGGVQGWLYGNGAIRLVDRNVFPLLEFSESKDGSGLVARSRTGQTYSLAPAPTGAIPLAAPEARPAPPPTASTAQEAPSASTPMTPAAPPAPDRSLRSETAPDSIPDVAAHEIPGSQPVLPAARLAPPGRQAAVPAAAPPAPAAQQASPADRKPMPGIYALDRFTEKDVCRIALEARPAALAEAETTLAPVRVLPGCRDSGIAVFDPVSWRFANGHMTLKAKRGHTVNLVANGEGGWRRDPDVGTTFVLRKVEP